MKRERTDISGRGSSTDKGSEAGAERPGWLQCSRQVGKWRERSAEARSRRISRPW